MNNIERYIQKAVKRELVAQSRVARRNDAARRRIDRRVYAIRHNDGIKDLVSKAIGSAKEIINDFKRLPTGKKIAILASRALQILGSFLSFKTIAEARSNLKEMDKVRAELQREYNEQANLTEAALIPRLQREYQGKVEAAAHERIPKASKMALKAFIGLLAFLTGTLGQKIISSSEEDMSRGEARR